MIRDEDGKWLDLSPFRVAGTFFMKNGYYISDPWGSPDWYEYWQTERNKVIKGVKIKDVQITGEHYFYMNYCPIQKAEDATVSKTVKVEGFPDFWDGDYEYFWCRKIARDGIVDALLLTDKEKEEVNKLKIGSEERNKKLTELYSRLKLKIKIKPAHLEGGYNFIVGKSRRKGYSYKAASIAACNYYTVPNSLTIFGAYEKKFLYPKGIFSMATNYINFINSNTAWAMPSDAVQRQDHIKASYIEYKNGIKTEQGFKSEIMALSFKDNADAARGKDALDIFFEESGAFGTPGLLTDSYAATVDCVMAGAAKTGMITVFGTSGDMEGGTADYAKMFNNPAIYGMLPIQNIWDENSSETECGFFHPMQWNLEGGFYDKNGNSNEEAAIQAEKLTRETLKKAGSTSSDIQKRMQEKPLSPSEAFASASMNNFPVVELNRQLSIVKNKNLQQLKGVPVEFSLHKGEVQVNTMLSRGTEPITSYINVPKNIRGCPIVYEFPPDFIPKGMYKIGYDPIRQEQGTSLASIIVYKSPHKGSLYHSNIVAEYVGRFESPEDIDRMAEMFAIYFNTKVMHENEVPAVRNYFRRIKKLHLLAHQPDAVISKSVKKSTVNRIYGCHMNQPLKDAGERYVKDWLLTVLDYDEKGNPITVIDRIYSQRLLEELINYNRKGNFDLVSALFMCMFQVQEEDLGVEYEDKPVKEKFKKLTEGIGNMYKRN